ncbi:hypothetical protein EON63_14720 [archaeon]|nr:MAG: hypothetical protein EON63_14720 [archaeon]
MDLQLSNLLSMGMNRIVRTPSGLKGLGPHAHLINDILERHYNLGWEEGGRTSNSASPIPYTHTLTTTHTTTHIITHTDPCTTPCPYTLLSPPVSLCLDAYMIVEVGADMSIHQFDFVDNIRSVGEYLMYGMD